MSAGWSQGSTRAWRATRARVLARDHGKCQMRVPKICVGASVPMHVHHIHGKASGCPGCAQDRYDHLISACAPCNLHTGDPGTSADPPAIPITRW